MSRVLLLFCVVAVAVAVVLWWRIDDRATVAPPSAGPASEERTPPAEVEAAGGSRQPVAEAASEPGSTPAEPAFDESPVIVERYALHVLVLDAAGEPVADAFVRAFDGKKIPRSELWPRSLGSDATHTYTRRDPDAIPIVVAQTGLDGRCVLGLDREMVFVTASADGAGRTGDLWVWHTRVPDELVLTLQRRIRLDGLVLRADGTPATEVAVDLRISGLSNPLVGMAERPEPTATDATGRFVAFLQPDTIYSVRASDGDQRTFRESVSTTSGQGDKQVTLRFPGARSVRGLLLDADAAAVPDGSIRIWEAYKIGVSDPDFDPFGATGSTGADGSFEIALPRDARIQLIGTAPGHATTEPAWVEVTGARPHVDVNLRLGRMGTIAGVVVDERGAPIAGAVVAASAEQGEWRGYSAIPTRDDLYPRVERVTAAADGSFELTGVHPGTTWRLVVIPDPARRRVTVRFAGHRPAEPPAVLRITDAQRRGSAIAGVVVEAATGAPIDEYELRLGRYEGTELRGTSDASWAKRGRGAFELTDLSLGERFGIAVLPKQFAPVFVGPIDTALERHEIEARVVPFAAVTCRVVDADGGPVFGARVAGNPVDRVPGAAFHSAAATDRDGKRHFARLPPGRTTFAVWSDQERLASIEVELLPGDNDDVVLTVRRQRRG